MSEIVKLSELDDNQLAQAIDVFIDGFYDTLKSISKDKGKIHRLFKYAFIDDMAYVYLHEGNAVGFLGIGNYQKSPVKLNKEIFLEELGKFFGRNAYNAVSASMEKIKINDPDEVFIDFIATHPEYRSMGIGKKLIEFICENLEYKYISLDVLTKNLRAKAFYERMGFKTISTKLDILVMLQGHGRRILMRMDVENRGK